MNAEKKNQILSKLEIISILDYRNKVQELFSKYFNDNEIEGLKNEPIQTIIGFFALKKAIKNLLEEIHPKLNIIEKEIIIAHNDLGAPIIKELNTEMPDKMNNKIHTSLSHTKNNVYGLAVLDTD